MAGQKLSLQQKLLQKLSPQQIQMIKLLELPAMQLEQRIKKELEENPVLEVEGTRNDSDTDGDQDNSPEPSESIDNEISIDEYINNEPSYKYKTNNFSQDDKKDDIPFSIGSTFHEYLAEQLGLLSLDEN